jgi:hypothetical protein
MSPEERQLLAGLFERTKAAAAAPRDQEAETFINEQIKAQPAAPYLLAQTVLVQDQALQAANQKLQQLEARNRELEAQAQKPASGGFLGGLFGSGVGAPRQAPPPPPPPAYGQPPGGPWGGAPQQPNYAAQGYAPQAPQPGPMGGGGFLKGALGTAAGVAGGVLLADSIRGLFHGGSAGGLGIGSGFEPGVHETVINNYYGDSPDSDTQQAGYDDSYDDSSDVQDAGYGDDGGFDSGGDGGFDV